MNFLVSKMSKMSKIRSKAATLECRMTFCELIFLRVHLVIIWMNEGHISHVIKIGEIG